MAKRKKIPCHVLAWQGPRVPRRAEPSLHPMAQLLLFCNVNAAHASGLLVDKYTHILLVRQEMIIGSSFPHAIRRYLVR